MATDEGLGEIAQAQRLLRSPRRRAIELEVRAAHAGSLHLEHDLAGAGRRIGEASQLDLAIAEENDAAHALVLLCELGLLAGRLAQRHRARRAFALPVGLVDALAEEIQLDGDVVRIL